MVRRGVNLQQLRVRVAPAASAAIGPAGTHLPSAVAGSFFGPLPLLTRVWYYFCCPCPLDVTLGAQQAKGDAH